MFYFYSLSKWMPFSSYYSDEQKNDSQKNKSTKSDSEKNESEKHIHETDEKQDDFKGPAQEHEDQDDRKEEERQSSEIMALLKPIYLEKQTAAKQPERESFWTFFLNKRDLNNSNNSNNCNNSSDSKRVDCSNRDLSWSQFIIQRQSFFYFNTKRLYQI